MKKHNALKYFLVFIISMLISAANAQNTFSVSGTVTDTENKKALYKANISLISGDTVCHNTTTDKKGTFIIKDIPHGCYILRISSLGFEQQEFSLENPSEHIRLDSIAMYRKAIDLQETVITARATRITDDRRIIYPTKELIETTADGVTLLSRMNLPLLSVIPGSKEVRYWGRGIIKYYINDAEATIEQVRAIQPKDIIKIEYIDRPGLEYTGGENVKLVLKFVTRKEQGLSSNISAGQYANRKSGNADIESRYNTGKSEFALSYHTGYSNPDKHINVLVTDETFHLPAGTLHRKEETTGASSKWRGHDVALAYFYNNPEKDYFYVKTEFQFSETPQNNTTSKLTNSGLRNDITTKTNLNNGIYKMLTAEMLYRHNISKRQTLRLEASYYLTLTDTETDYAEHNGTETLNHLITLIDGKAEGFSVKGLYTNKLSDKWNIQTYIRNDYRTARNLYSGTAESRSDVSVNLTTLSSRLSYTHGKLSASMGAYMDINHTDIKGYRENTRIEPGISANGRYSFSNRNYAGVSLSGYLTSPSVEDLSTATQVIDEIQVRKGNPELKKGHTVSCHLNGGFGTGSFDFYAYAYCEYSKNSIWEETFLDGNTVIRMPNNFDYIIAFKSGIEASGKIFKWLSGNAALGYNRYQSKSAEYGKTHKYGKLWIRANIAATWKRWLLSYIVWTHNNDFYGETLGTSGRSMAFTLSRTWLKGSLPTAISLYNPFAKNFSRQSTINYSSIAPYSNRTRYDFGFRALTLNISYNFNFGRKSSNERIGTNVKTNTGIINSNKSGKVK